MVPDFILGDEGEFFQIVKGPDLVYVDAVIIVEPLVVGDVVICLPDHTDDSALSVLPEFFPGKEIIPVDFDN